MKNVFGIILTLILFVFSIVGCASIEKSSICDNIPDGQDCVICQLAERLKTTPEIMAATLQIANLAALESEAYSASDADAFVDKIIKVLEDLEVNGIPITYLDVVNYIDFQLKILPPKVRAVFSIIDPMNLAFKDVDLPLSEYDISLLISHLRKQKKIIAAYL